MAMNSREKLLAAGVGVIATLFVGQSVVSSIQGGFDKKKQLIESLEKKKNEQGLQVTAGVVASQKLNKVVARSLSVKEETARAEYMKWLISLGEEAQLDAPTPEGIGDNIEKDRRAGTWRRRPHLEHSGADDIAIFQQNRGRSGAVQQNLSCRQYQRCTGRRTCSDRGRKSRIR